MRLNKYKISTVSILLLCVSCTDYYPKPRGYIRLEFPSPQYKMLLSDDIPYMFNISQLACIDFPPVMESANWLNIIYPSLNASIYCSYIPVTYASLRRVEKESRDLITRQFPIIEGMKEKEYENPLEKVYGTLFLLKGETASPIQFILTDSIKHFFRGALYYNISSNVDSLAPVTSYLERDVIELIQSFRWKN